MDEEKKTSRPRRLRGFAALFLLLVTMSMVSPFAAIAQVPLPIVNPSQEAKDAAAVVVDEAVTKPFQIAFLTIIWNFLTFVSQRIAYEAAVALATAGPGQEPLIDLQNPTDLQIGFAQDVGGAAIDALSSTLSAVNIHFNICSPEAPAARLVLQLGIKSAFDRPEPVCDWQSIAGNWQGFVADSFGDDNPDQFLLSNFAQAINPRTTDLTAGITLYTQVVDDSNLNKQVGFAKYLSDHGYKAVSDVITGTVKTPADVIERDWKSSQVWEGPGTQEANIQIFNSLLSAKELWGQLGLSALSMFSNTLLSKFTERVYSGLFDVKIDDSSPFDVASIGFSGGVEAAEAHFRTLLAFSPTKLDTFNIITEFTTCSGTTTRGLDNCVMDSNFATAVGGADSDDPFTVQEAIDEGLIQGSWPLIGPTDSRNIDDGCYGYGFCYANLVRMRLARVIPVGWEMAAELQSGSSTDTLQTVIDAFDDESSPYYHLIDPNWLLKYPTTQCNALVAGQLVSDTGLARDMECVDAPSCIREDASGTCIGGYGYCAREENTWNFSGTDCPEYYATCLTFDNGDGAEGAWLLNTTNSDGCDADSAGCLWYSTEQEETDDAFDWPTMDDVPGLDAADDTYLSRLYFNNNVETCDAEDAGCTQVIEKTDDVSLNLILNPSFETDDDADGVPDKWAFTGVSTYSEDEDADFGVDAVTAGFAGTSGIVYQTAIPIQQSSFYTLSFYAAQQSSTASVSATVYAVMASEDGSEEVDLTGTSYETDNCTIADLDATGGEETIQMEVTPTSDSYERFTCTFTSPTFTDSALGARIQYLDFLADGLLIDGVQLEAGEDVSDYREGYGASVDQLSPTYFKLPPSYLGCTGDEDVDPAECEDYAPVCSAQDVGCELYTPDNGDPSVPGIAGDLDECPSACVGYDTFKQEPTNYEPGGNFPVFFIPSSAVACSETYVGCDEFTNLSDESLEYYTYLRACLTPEQTSDEANFYTWEGSDLEGFQLKSWTLLESDLSSSDAWADDAFPEAAPCTDWTATSSSIVCNDDVATLEDDGTCNDHDDIFDEPDCREFYDADGNIHYRRFSETVTISDVCSDYRKTEVVGDDTAEQDANCTDAGGYWDGAIGECRFFGLPEESTECPAEVNGCREYTGGTGRNSSIVYEDDVEDEDIDEYRVSGADAEVSNESVATDGHSMHITATSANGYLAVAAASLTSACTDSAGCEASEGTLGFTCTVEEDATDCGELVDELAAGKTYVLSFWAKADASDVTLTPEFIEEGGSGTVRAFNDVTLSVNWERYTVGPLDTTDYDDFDDTAELAFVVGASGDEVYLDTITLRQTEEAITVIKDSWNTPAECDETPEGASSPQYYLGCQQYTDSAGEDAYLKSFTRLCSENKVGCEAFYDTELSDSPYGAVYNLTCEYGNSGGSSYDPDLADPFIVSNEFDCSIDGTSYCTILAGQSSCQFDIEEGAIPQDFAALIDGTLPYEDIGEGAYGATLRLGPDTRVVSPDSLVYFVADDTYACDAEVMGCTTLGQPTFSADQTRVDSWTDVYLLNIVDDYEDILCSDEALFCDAWETTQDGTYYFKNPETKTCEYRTNVSINATDYTGWFRTGTDEFCYGTGTCSVSEAACETDSDCTGSTDDEADTCEIDTGTYMIGGTESAIWFNGDDDYVGWVGECTDQYNLCSEFIDPVDVDQDAGEFYGDSAGSSSFFLNNDLLDETNLSTSKRCNGQVSQKKGCVLFENTTEAELNYNASASYALSVHADQFYSTSTSYDLVDPVSCPDDGEYTALDGTSYDLCTSRCAYLSENLHPYDDYSSEGGEDLYTFTISCLADADCPTIKSDGGDAVTGSCELSSFTGTDDSTVTVPSLEDDTNEVHKVDLDRACAQWLSCNTTTKVWDENIQAFVNVCDSIGLCNEYNALGEATSCGNWMVDAVPTVLTTEEYQGRDVSWYGHDYSGFSIPGTVLASHLVQENVNPTRWCVDTADDGVTVTQTIPEGEDLPYVDCSEDESVCDDVTPSGEDADVTCEEADEDFRLVFDAGTCDSSDDDGDSCTIGFCGDTGAPCATSDDCNTDISCDTGYCYYGDLSDEDLFTSGPECDSDADCASSGIYSYCESGICAYHTSESCSGSSDCTSDTTSANAGCFTAARTQTGMCVNSSCLASPMDENDDGKLDQFSFDDAEELECRGWPEATSPFGGEVVDMWIDAATNSQTSSATDSDDRPYQTFSTFDGVNVCAGGQECDCSYDTVEYSLGKVMYFDQGGEDAPTLVCVGGNYDGAQCDGPIAGSNDTITNNSGTVYCSAGGGVCNYLTTQQTNIGLEGFCLQRDTAITMNGDQNQAPCLAWLPVDRAAGATDIYGKSTEAGYPLEATFYCAEPEPYVDLGTSFFDGGSNVSACAELDGSTPGSPSDCRSGTEYNCVDSISCPDGFYAIMGRCSLDDADAESGGVDSGTMIASCYEALGATAAGEGTDDDNDCPFVCIPENSYLYDSGSEAWTSCSAPETLDDSFSPSFDAVSDSSSDGTVVYRIEATDATTFDDVAEYYRECKVRGIANDQELYDDFDAIDYSDTRWLFFNAVQYPACTTLVEAASVEENVAWTDRLLFEDADTLFQIDDAAGSVAELFYSKNTGVTPAGRSNDPEVQNAFSDAYPVTLASCVVQTTFDSDNFSWDTITLSAIPTLSAEMTLPTGSSFSSCTTGSVPEQMVGGNSNPEGRSFVDIDIPNTGYMMDTFDYSGETVSDAIDRIGQLFANVTIGSSWTWNNTTQQYEAAASGWDSTYDTNKSDTGDDLTDGSPSAPVVRAVGETCVGQYCREGEDDAFSINGSYDEDLTSAGGSFFADLKFFVEADPNQMPIRRVIVDWADETGGNFTGSMTDDNYYKNRRGLDPTNAQYCDDTGADNWGQKTNACDTNFFNAQHYFTCSQGLINTLVACETDSEGQLDTSPCTAGGYGDVCVYQPRVHVRDNWGWCTGECPDTATGADGTDGCYDGSNTSSFDSTSADNECDLNRPNGAVFSSSYSEDDPWIYYDGVISVEP